MGQERGRALLFKTVHLDRTANALEQPAGPDGETVFMVPWRGPSNVKSAHTRDE